MCNICVFSSVIFMFVAFAHFPIMVFFFFMLLNGLNIRSDNMIVKSFQTQQIFSKFLYALSLLFIKLFM